MSDIIEELSAMQLLKEKADKAKPVKLIEIEEDDLALMHIEFEEQINYERIYILVRKFDCVIEFCSPKLEDVREIQKLLEFNPNDPKSADDYAIIEMDLPEPGLKLYNRLNIAVERVTFKSRIIGNTDMLKPTEILTEEVILLMN